VLFSDLEGRLHLLDYDKKFLLGAYENLTFDGSSIRGFTAQKESDLRLGIDWSAFYWVPADVFGNGKVLVFGNVIDKDGTAYSGDLRGVLKGYSDKLFAEKTYTLNAATEIEGFLFAGKDAEQRYHETGKFEFINTGGYYHVLPLDPLRQFIDTRPRCSAPWASRTRRTTPKSRPASSRSTTATLKWSPRRPDPALQAAHPPDRQQHGLHRLLPAQAGRRRQRQRHAHQRLRLQGQDQPLLG
jgi:glutamine synthetase